jgi:hypothetical protein
MRTAGSSPAGQAVRFSRRARVLPGVLALLVVTGCAGTGHASPAARAITSCGPDRVPGYSNHRSYPPGIPTLPAPGTRIAGCFASPAQAAARGFSLAVPEGTVIVRRVFLLPTGAVMRSQCRSAARMLRFAVPCPGLLPSTSATPLSCPTGGRPAPACGSRRRLQRSGCLSSTTGSSLRPATAGSAAWRRGTWCCSPSGPRRSRPPATGRCLLEPACAADAVHRRVRASVAACPQGSYQTGGHVLLHWVHRGVLAGVSFHGVNATNIALDLVVARHMTWVGPLF